MKYKALIFLVLALFSFSLFGQEEKDRKKKKKEDTEEAILVSIEAPQAVQKAFKKKHNRATDVSWDTLNNLYVAQFTLYEKTGTAQFTKDGKWIQSVLIIDDERDLMPTIQNYLKDNARDKKFIRAENFAKNTKENYFFVYMVLKGKGNEDLIYKYMFSKIGRYETVYEPEIKIEQEVNGETEERNNDFNEIVEETLEEQQVEGIFTDSKLKMKELPTPITSYIDDNFDFEWKVKKIWIKDTEKYGRAYYISMKREGKKEWSEMYFGIDGKLLNREDISE